MTKPTRQRHFGADGEIKFVPHRNLYVGFWGGRVVVTKRTSDACAEVLAREYGTRTTVMPSEAQPRVVVGKELQEFVDRENKMAELFNRKQLDLADAASRQTVADSIDCQLSPENLTCDGELSRAEVDRRYRFLRRVAAQLIQLDPSVKFYEFSI